MPRRARALVMDLISRGREAGTPEAEAARRSVARFLTELGYIVQEHSFRFNAGVYRLLAAAGALLAGVALVEIPLLQHTAPAWGALVVLLALAGTIVVVTGLIVRGYRGPGPVRVDANLIASRPGSTVRCWLVAHLDTKAQAQSMAGRLVAVWVTVLAVTALLVSALLRTGHPLSAGPAAAAGAAGVLAGVLLSRGRLSGSSPGARDNGSGLLAVLTAAELATDPSIGVIVTGAEEFGLVGASALARERPGLFAGALVVNVDTVDDTGTLYVVTHGPASADLAARVRDAVAGLAPVIRQRRLPLGIMVDGLPLSHVACESVTLGRLDWSTLTRIHTPRDDADGYHLGTAERLGERLARPI